MYRIPTLVVTLSGFQARAQEITKLLKTTYGRAVAIDSDSMTNSLVIGALEGSTDAIKWVVEQLDKPLDFSNEKPATKVYHLAYANASSVVEILRTTVKGAGLDGIAGDPNTNSLVVTANTETQNLILKVVMELDRPTH